VTEEVVDVLIEDLMTRSPVTVDVGATLADAALRMREGDVGSVVVVDGNEPVGILTDRDVALYMAGEVEDARVEKVMSMHPIAVARDEDVERCLERMAAGQVRRILVIDEDGALVGVVSLDDVLVHLAGTLGKAAELIRAELTPV
jgi:CBS domain-containing protein